jgi:hypothetical protein
MAVSSDLASSINEASCMKLSMMTNGVNESRESFPSLMRVPALLLPALLVHSELELKHRFTAIAHTHGPIALAPTRIAAKCGIENASYYGLCAWK